MDTVVIFISFCFKWFHYLQTDFGSFTSRTSLLTLKQCCKATFENQFEAYYASRKLLADT